MSSLFKWVKISVNNDTPKPNAALNFQKICKIIQLKNVLMRDKVSLCISDTFCTYEINMKIMLQKFFINFQN